MGPLGQCLACISEDEEYNAAQLMGRANGHRPSVDDAVTMAPTWQQHEFRGQLMFACVAVPTCRRHLSRQELSPAARAAVGGVIIPGVVNG